MFLFIHWLYSHHYKEVNGCYNKLGFNLTCGLVMLEILVSCRGLVEI
jgi:hypothetical protein